MKKFFFSFVMLVACKCALCTPVQLSVHIKNREWPAISLVLLYGDGHFSAPLVNMPAKRHGFFQETLDISFPVFALLKFPGNEQRILLTPGRHLAIDIQMTGDSAALTFSSTAAAENNLFRSLDIGPIPFFMKDDWQTNSYAVMSADSLQMLLVDSLDKMIQQSDHMINLAKVPETLKILLKKEKRYVLQCYLNDLATNYMRWKNNPDDQKFASLVMSWQPMPDSSTLTSGFFANMIWRYQIAYKINSVARQAGKDKEKLAAAIEAVFKTPFEEMNQKVKTYGERYIVGWMYARVQLSRSVQDKMLLNKVLDAANDGQIASAQMMLDTMQHYFPSSKYLPIAVNEISKIKQQLAKNQSNSSIKIHTSVKPVSLDSLVAEHRGKLVYIDIWGTWCGPCRIEMSYVAALKKRYAGKDVVFVYLDMDGDDKESAWKEYIHLYGIEGEHYRLTKEQIEPIWEEIKKAGGQTHRYPTYILFDKQGKMVHANAERPSSEQTLFRQIDEVL